jgi:hypothetical protein
MTEDRDWKRAGERALTIALDKAGQLAGDCGDIKQLDGLIKTIGEVVGTGIALNMGGDEKSGEGDDDDE